MSERKCKQCDSLFIVTRKDKVYCSTSCSADYHNSSHSEYRVKNKEHISSKTKEWFEQNKDKRREYKRLYYKNRKKIDPAFKIKANLRSRLASAVRGKDKSTEALLGCSYSDLIKHLCSQFHPHPQSNKPMMLENYGEWEVDHKLPLSHFDLLDAKQLAKVCHYTNLQPLWKDEHLVKSVNDRI